MKRAATCSSAVARSRVEMIRYLVAGVKHALRLHRPGRRLPVQPDDILLASYPKSGSAWTRWLLANLVNPDREASHGNLHQLILDPDVSTKRDFDGAPRPRIINSNSSFDPRYRRVIYLVRDPRDVAVSQLNGLSKEEQSDSQLSVEQFVERFLAGGNAACRVSTDGFGSWGENVGSWMATRFGKPGFLLVRYEDLLADTVRELMRVAEFAGLTTNVQRISQAIERSSAIRLEHSTWRSDLPEFQIARIEEAWGDIMACLGYELATRDSRSALDSSLIGLLAAGAAR